MSKQDTKHSKFLSLVLRHKPETIGVTLDENGWIEVDALLQAMADHGRYLDSARLERLVSESDKQRFAFSADGSRIRANQGHSVEVNLDLPPRVPPERLFHGTVEKFLGSIFSEGLIKGQRHHVHLSLDFETAVKVGQRRGKPVILEVAAGEMHSEGHQFFVSENRVWLVDAVPPGFLRRLP